MAVLLVSAEKVAILKTLSSPKYSTTPWMISFFLDDSESVSISGNSTPLSIFINLQKGIYSPKGTGSI